MAESTKTENKTEKIPLMIYGMQRTGTNYIEKLLIDNLDNIKLCNGLIRCLPDHKHFRLHDEKFVVPEPKYFNSFSYEDFNSFKNHVEKLVGVKISQFIVVIKHPFGWYSSYLKHAKKYRYHINRKSFNSHFMIDYNHFYKKWITFSNEAPDKVKIIKYEEVLSDRQKIMSELCTALGSKFLHETILNPDKVYMSKSFTNKRLRYYTQKKFKDIIDNQNKEVILNLLDDELHDFYDLEF